MTTVLGCIADDFTGATDIAGLLARSGLPVSLRIGVPSESPRETSPFEVIALKSRTAPVNTAKSEALSALSWLQQAGAQRFFWKYCSTFDSTPEGNIGPVAEALMDALGLGQTIYCPAFPENGRSVYMGNLFVGQQPLAESPMQYHPLTPMKDSNLLRLLTPQVKKPVGLLDRPTIAKGENEVRSTLSKHSSNGIAHVVVDAVETSDLEVIANVCKDMPLLTGGSAIAMPLPSLYLADGLIKQTSASLIIPEIDRRTIILSGSCSAMTNSQVDAYLKKESPAFRLDPLDLAKNGPQDVLTWLADQDLTKAPLVYATADPKSVKAAQDILGVARAGSLVEETLAACAVVARDAGAGRIVVAGGETSGAVTKALQVDRLNIGPEIAPGVPWTFCQSEGKVIALALKSGNFGSPSFFSDAQTILRQS